MAEKEKRTFGKPPPSGNGSVKREWGHAPSASSSSVGSRAIGQLVEGAGKSWPEAVLLLPVPKPNPDKARNLNHEDANTGWKIHLNFDPENAEAIGKIRTYLDLLSKTGACKTYKIGMAGEQPGKEATVYSNSLDEVLALAGLIELGVGESLLSPAGDVLYDDVPLSPNDLVWGRFHLDGDENLSRYGDGAPFLDADFMRWTTNLQFHDAITRDQMRERAIPYMIGTYGPYFNGTEVHFEALHARKEQYLTEHATELH